MKIILATHNQDKVRELEEILALPEVELFSTRDYGISLTDEESGKTYAENALIKAREAHRKLPGEFILADDSGLSIDLLDGYPGIYSARFAGVDTAYPDKIKALWQLLQPYPQEQWTGAFHCALAFIEPQGEERIFEAECSGLILPEMRGGNGFGYDPIFYSREHGMTTAEMDPALKNEISHRGQAARMFKNYLTDLMKDK